MIGQEDQVTDCEVCNVYAAARLLIIGRAIIRRHGLARRISSVLGGDGGITVVVDKEQLVQRLGRFLRGVHARHTAGLSIDVPA